MLAVIKVLLVDFVCYVLIALQMELALELQFVELVHDQPMDFSIRVSSASFRAL